MGSLVYFYIQFTQLLHLKRISIIESVETSRWNIMSTQYNRKITQSKLRNATIIPGIIMLYICTRHNTYQDIKKLNNKTYRIKKLKLPEIRSRNYSQTYTQTGLTTRYEKPYQNRTITQKITHFGTVSKNIKSNVLSRNRCQW